MPMFGLTTYCSLIADGIVVFASRLGSGGGGLNIGRPRPGGRIPPGPIGGGARRSGGAPGILNRA